MHIGIDATALPAQPVGAGNYIIYLIRYLIEICPDFDFTVFIQRSRSPLLNMKSGPGLKLKEVPDMPPALRLIWEQVAFPQVIRKTGIDLLHSPHYTMPLAMENKSIVTFHDMTFFLFPQLHTIAKRVFFPLAIQASARRATALIADSESTRRDTIRLLRVLPNKIFTVPLGVSEHFHRISDEELLTVTRTKYRLPERFILYVGLIEPRKNLPLLLNAYKSAQEYESLPVLVVAGRFGWGYKEVLHITEMLGLSDKVCYIGHVPHSDLPMIYSLAEFFVYPSTYEGFGLPPLEAMACGTPVITTATSSIPEHVGDAGLLIPPGDKNALIQALITLETDRVMRDELAEKGPERAAAFSWKRTAQETLRVYQYAVNEM